MKTLLFLIILALIIGGGLYWYRQSPRSLSSLLPRSASPGEVTSSSTPTPSLIPPAIDATWQTYRNKILNFSFQYPTKGKFAPTFNVKLLPLNSPEVVNDCYQLPQGVSASKEAPQKQTIADINFCRTLGFIPGTNGSQTEQEYWVAKYDTWYAVISFSKKVTDLSQSDACKTGSASTTARCQPFDYQGLRTQIEQIISTFINATGTPAQR